ncbi:MAG TPA: glycoside hydrolase family 3 C-terminal domain-containing protein [Candidatus Acidoferrales bacterium]|nr:glycoside hydrolase family 3 C-terminal domain-containing protein [Candidatus Acidoferrales bacterium]
MKIHNFQYGKVLNRAAWAIGLAGICFGLPCDLRAQSWTNTTLSASQRAGLLLAQMTFSEKAAMVYGTGGAPGGNNYNYVGNITNNSRLGIPWLFLQDGPAGVRLQSGNNTTALPAPITLAATWDVALARQYGSTMGAEARGKGVDVQLGPMMNMARVYEDGRAFEGYGEDPYLAGAMDAAEIPGLQSQGVIATAKHFVCNDQETQRTSISADVDPRTLQEIYEAPFRASVRAGVGAVMASYNLVNSVHACEWPGLNADLKKEYGFNGWVMSDWGANFSVVGGMNNGLDMDMYSGQFTPNNITAAIQSGNVPAAELDGMVQRILTSMFQFGIFDNPPTGNLSSPVMSPAHNQFARDAAAAGTVLLQNNGGLLPLGSSVHTIAVIGSVASTSPISVGGGSASVTLPYNITPLAGITSRAGSSFTVSYAQGDGASVPAAVQLATNSDVAIVCVGQQTSEGSDRSNLSLPNGQDALISAVAAANPHTIVVMYESSATLMPWANQVAAVLMAWYPGQENGNALAQVLFGDVNPSGKLPVSIPPSSSQVPTSTTAQWPGINGHATYSEGLEIGYRWYDTNNVAPLFAFGYGLSYTAFGYSNLTVSAVSPSGQVQIGFDLTNTGGRTGAEVPQLYLGFPAAASEPPKQLKGFQKISLSPGQTQHVTFNLDWEDLAIWNPVARGWIVTPGSFQVMVGASSRDLRLIGAFTVASVPSSDLANAALHQPVAVSSVFSTNSPGAAAVDGDTVSAWTSLAGDPQWIEVDLGLIKDLSRVRLHWNTNYASSYTIQMSPDGTNWTELFSTNNDVGGTEDILVSGRGRYVQISGTQQGLPGAGYSLSELEVFSQPQAPFGGTVPTVPGVIQAEDYDTGGEGVAYYNTTVGNPGGVYRSDDVGIEPTSDTGGGYDVNSLNTGEWLEYTINPPNPLASYSISVRVAAPAAGGQLRVRLNGAVVGTAQIPNTGGWQTWQTITLPIVSLAGGIGSQALRLEVITNGFSINWIGLNVMQRGTNIALYKAATASSLENAGFPATNAFDGNLATRWSSQFSDPQWIYVDLGASCNIAEVVLYWEAAYGKSYQIQVSSDATNWTTIYSTTTGLGGTEDLAGLSGTGRYVRMYGTARGTIYGYSLWEFQVYGTPVVPALYGASITNGQFGFWINGNAATNYTIMASTNLTSWNPILTTNPPSLPYFWVDTNSPAYPVRFYRTVSGP